MYCGDIFNNLLQNILEKKIKNSFNQYIENWPQNNSEGKFVATPKTLRQGLWATCYGDHKKKKKKIPLEPGPLIRILTRELVFCTLKIQRM